MSRPRRLRGALLGAAATLVMLTGSATTYATAAPPTTTLAAVERAYPQLHVQPAGIAVPGMDLFALSGDRRPLPDGNSRPTIVAIVGGVGGVGHPILEGSAVTRAAIKATRDAAIVAEVALAVDRRPGEILVAPRNEEQKRARVAAPAIIGNTLSFWVWTTGVVRMLRLARLDLTTGALELVSPPLSGDDEIADAIESLKSTSLSLQRGAIATLSAACASSEAARKALFSALAHHRSSEVRAQLADAGSKCGAAALDPLIHALESDSEPLVRQKAALALGKIGDAKARPALERAARSSDGELAYAAKSALADLK